jgi:dUTP pyrophosphatase
VEQGQRIAQLIIQPYIRVNYHEGESLSTTDRGAGGFGSTGK